MEKTSVLAKLKQGDETSFTFVYDHYWRKVYRFSAVSYTHLRAHET